MDKQRLMTHCLCMWILCGITGCVMDPVDSKLKVNNRTSDTLFALANMDYPDTSLPSSPAGIIYPRDTLGIPLGNNTWENVLQKKGYITVYITKYADRRRFGERIEKYEVLKKSLLSKAELDSLNWTVPYP